ncbi:MAG: nucleotidyltransferase domain-containing protein [Burkholderiaceae bacterium]|nr:nucleotidyltransferase domain-containing protein [Burkholderiaceae bacterium]
MIRPYARGDWGVGSDVDVVVVVERVTRRFAERALDFDATALPVPADVLVYTEDEWRALPDASPHFARRLAAETVWVL